MSLKEAPPAGTFAWEPTKERICPSPKLAIFIDGPYFSKAADLLGLRNKNLDFDFEKMLRYLADLEKVTLIGAKYYTGLSFSPSAQPFFRKMESFGYEIIKSKENPVTGKKAPVDHYLVTDLCLAKDSFDIATVISGDGDFAYPIEKLAVEFGKKINIVAARHNISTDLLALANKYPLQVSILFLGEHYRWFTMRRVFSQRSSR